MSAVANCAGSAQQESPAVAFHGVQHATVELSPYGSASIDLHLVPLRAGVHTISSISVRDEAEQRPLGSVTPTQIFVQSSQALAMVSRA